MSREKFLGVDRLLQRFSGHTHSSGGTITLEPTFPQELPSDHETLFIPADYIIVDDQDYQARQTEENLRVVLPQDKQIRRVMSAKELFRYAFPAEGNQPVAILLDYELEHTKDAFRLSPDLFGQGKAIPSFLFDTVDGLNLALALRAEGYRGIVATVSSVPPPAEEIEIRKDRFNKQSQNFMIENLVDRYFQKGQRFYAVGRSNTGEWDIQAASNPVAALGKALFFDPTQT